MSCDHEETIAKQELHAACMCCKSQYDEFWQLSKLNLFDSTNSKPVLTPDTLPVSDMHRTTPFTAGPSTRHPFSFLAMDVTVNAQLQEPRFAFALNLEAWEKNKKKKGKPIGEGLSIFGFQELPGELPLWFSHWYRRE